MEKNPAKQAIEAVEKEENPAKQAIEDPVRSNIEGAGPSSLEVSEKRTLSLGGRHGGSSQVIDKILSSWTWSPNSKTQPTQPLSTPTKLSAKPRKTLAKEKKLKLSPQKCPPQKARVKNTQARVKKGGVGDFSITESSSQPSDTDYDLVNIVIKKIECTENISITISSDYELPVDLVSPLVEGKQQSELIQRQGLLNSKYIATPVGMLSNVRTQHLNFGPVAGSKIAIPSVAQPSLPTTEHQTTAMVKGAEKRGCKKKVQSEDNTEHQKLPKPTSMHPAAFAHEGNTISVSTLQKMPIPPISAAGFINMQPPGFQISAKTLNSSSVKNPEPERGLNKNIICTETNTTSASAVPRQRATASSSEISAILHDTITTPIVSTLQSLPTNQQPQNNSSFLSIYSAGSPSTVQAAETLASIAPSTRKERHDSPLLAKLQNKVIALEFQVANLKHKIKELVDKVETVEMDIAEKEHKGKGNAAS